MNLYANSNGHTIYVHNKKGKIEENEQFRNFQTRKTQERIRNETAKKKKKQKNNEKYTKTHSFIKVRRLYNHFTVAAAV